MSDINPNNIDREFPVAGQDQSSEGFRQNFTATADNFTTAKREITDLQNKVLLKAALTGSLLNNDMAGAIIQSATMRDMRLSVYPITDFPMSTVVVDPINGTYQYASLVAGNYNLQVSISPINNTITQIFLEISAAQGTTLQFQGSSSGVSYQGLQAVAGVVNTNNGPTLVFQQAADRNAGTARIFSIVIRSTSNSGGSSGVVTVTDISDLQTRVRVGEPASQGTNYVGSQGDRAGDIRITAPSGTAAAKIWWCFQDFASANGAVIWSQVVGSEKDLGPQGPANSVQINNAASGVFQGDTTFVFSPPTRDQSNTPNASGSLTLGTILGGAVDANIWGNVNFVAGTMRTGNLNIPGNGYVNANLIGNIRGNIAGGNITGDVFVGNTANITVTNITTATITNITGSRANISDATIQSLYLAGYQFVPVDTSAVGTQNYASLVAGGDLPAGSVAFRDQGPSRAAEGAVQFWSAANSRAFSGNGGLTWSSNILSVAGNVAAANITANVDITSIGGNITAQANSFNMTGGYITADFFSGDGRFLSNLNLSNAVGGYNDTNVRALLSGGTVQTVLMAPAGNIRSDSYFNLSGANVLYSDANVQAYLPSYNGRMGNLDFDGNRLTTLGNVTTTANAVFDFTLGNIGNFRLPGGSNTQVLTTYGNGNLYWSTPTGGGGNATAAGQPGEIQFYTYDGSNTLQASNRLSFEPNSSTLTVGDDTGNGNGTISVGVISANSLSLGNALGVSILAQGNIQGNVFIGNGAGLTSISNGVSGLIQISGGPGSRLSYANGFSIDNDPATNLMSVVNFSATGNIDTIGYANIGNVMNVAGNASFAGQELYANSASANINYIYTTANIDSNSQMHVRASIDSDYLRGQMIANTLIFVGLEPFDANIADGRVAPTSPPYPGGNILIQDYTANGANASNALLTITTLGMYSSGDDEGNLGYTGTTARFGNAYFSQEGNITATDTVTGNAVVGNITITGGAISGTSVTATGNVTGNNINANTSFRLPVYASNAARDSAITGPQPGMMIFVTGSGMQVRGASTWNTVAGTA